MNVFGSSYHLRKFCQARFSIVIREIFYSGDVAGREAILANINIFSVAVRLRTLEHAFEHHMPPLHAQDSA